MFLVQRNSSSKNEHLHKSIYRHPSWVRSLEILDSYSVNCGIVHNEIMVYFCLDSLVSLEWAV
jgi:hypothetical protein